MFKIKSWTKVHKAICKLKRKKKQVHNFDI